MSVQYYRAGLKGVRASVCGVVPVVVEFRNDSVGFRFGEKPGCRTVLSPLHSEFAPDVEAEYSAFSAAILHQLNLSELMRAASNSC